MELDYELASPYEDEIWGEMTPDDSSLLVEGIEVELAEVLEVENVILVNMRRVIPGAAIPQSELLSSDGPILGGRYVPDWLLSPIAVEG